MNVSPSRRRRESGKERAPRYRRREVEVEGDEEEALFRFGVALEGVESAFGALSFAGVTVSVVVSDIAATAIQNRRVVDGCCRVCDHSHNIKIAPI